MTTVSHLKEALCLVYPKSWQNPNFDIPTPCKTSGFETNEHLQILQYVISFCFFRRLHITLYQKQCWYCGLANYCSLQNNIILTRGINPQKRYNTYNNMNTQLWFTYIYKYAGLQIHRHIDTCNQIIKKIPKIVLIILLLLTSKMGELAEAVEVKVSISYA